jgi:hypothetical protein
MDAGMGNGVHYATTTLTAKARLFQNNYYEVGHLLCTFPGRSLRDFGPNKRDHNATHPHANA